MKGFNWMRLYGWVFLLSGAAFVLFPNLVTTLIVELGWRLPGARPLRGEDYTLWLGLTGSMMAMISFLSFALARDPDQPLAWDVLLLSKGCSTLLFVLFAIGNGNTLFLAGALTDGPIFLHIFYLMRRAELAAEGSRDYWAPRSTGPKPAGYEVWFLKLNDPAGEWALWLRYTITLAGRAPGAACWFVFFDAKNGTMSQGRHDVPLEKVEFGGENSLCKIGASALGRAFARGETPGISWDLNWEDSVSPPFAFVPACLYRWGVAGTIYGTPLSGGRMSGSFTVDGRVFKIESAPASVGHLWGRRMGDNWRWAHAVLPDGAGGPAVFEIISAQAKIGPFKTPRVTTANLWYAGRHYASTGLRAGLKNETHSDGAGWGFRVDFGGLTAAGECAPRPGLTAEVEYADTDGRRLVCENSKTGTMRLSLRSVTGEDLGSLEAAGTAAVETVR